MGELRRWHLDNAAPTMLTLAADARLSATDYTDDQVWESVPGAVDLPAMAMQTHYGGRVGLASVVPIWRYQGRDIHLYQAYASPPVITAFAPGFMRLEARIAPQLAVTADHWVMESHACGVRYMVSNKSTRDETLRLDVFGHVSRRNRNLPLAIVTLIDGLYGLSLGRLSGIEPIVLLEGATLAFETNKLESKIGAEQEVKAGETVTFRWVQSGLDKLAGSLERAQFWMRQDWDAAIVSIQDAAEAMPVIETGDIDTDAAIAFSTQALVQSMVDSTGKLPYGSFVATRSSNKGHSAAGDGSDYGRGWNGQNVFHAYLVASSLALIDPQLAQGIVRNYISIQDDDGGVDVQPGLGGQRQGLLASPLLSRMARNIYLYTNDLTFIKQVYQPLLHFLNRWSSQDFDNDLDIMPEYQDERQTGYVFWPTFGRGQSWAQNANIRQFETPDMAAYMLSEITSLSSMGRALQDQGTYELMNRMTVLQRFLEKLWYEPEKRYAYQDRDTDITAPRIDVLTDAAADEEHIISMAFDVPSRLVVRVTGGVGGNRPPKLTLKLSGLDQDGNSVAEQFDQDAFTWGYGYGVVSTDHQYTRLDRVHAEGLSRVFKLDVGTLDTTRLDITALMPLILAGLPENRAEHLIRLLTDEAHFWQASGLSLVSASDRAYDPSSAAGGGGTWVFWTSLLCEGLVEYGRHDLAVRILKRLMKTQTQVLKRHKQFFEFYHSEEPLGLGERSHVAGIVPLHVLMSVLGVQIMNRYSVYTGGPFAWGRSITVRQHGVTVMRTDSGTQIVFPSGYSVKLGANEALQIVQDLTVQPDELAQTLEGIVPPPVTETGLMRRVVIEVQEDDEQSDPTG